MSPKRIAVIGAGINGLCALRRMSELPDTQITCFERNYEIGGAWLYTDETKENEFGRPVYSPMYNNLVCSIPRKHMEIDDFPFEDGTMFPTRTEIVDYINCVAEKLDLRRLIKFNIEVMSIRPVDLDKRETEFVIEYCDTRKNMEKYKEVFDSVIVCNGTFRLPNIPTVDGEASFKGLAIHSVRYRKPELFRDQIVAILGAAVSGVDIAFDLTKFAKKVYLCHRGQKLVMPLLNNIIEKTSTFSRFTPNSVILENKEELQVDSVIYATGYKYDLPLLPDVTLQIGVHKIISNLFKCIMSPEYCNLFFMGIPKEIPSFLFADHQALFVKAVIEGSACLPNKSEKTRIIAKDAEAGVGLYNCFEWDKELSEIAGNFSPCSQALKELWDKNYINYLAGEHYKEFFSH